MTGTTAEEMAAGTVKAMSKLPEKTIITKRKISEIIFEIRSKKHHQRNTIKKCMTKAAEEAAASECRRMEK